MAELHIIGEIQGASKVAGNGVFCRWGITYGRGWELLEGLESGQTHVDFPSNEDAVWSHPLDLHYACSALTGWPKLHFQLWSQDEHGRNDICGYCMCHIPAAPGVYELECPTWLPEGTLGERLSAFFVGGNPRLKMEEVIHSPADRFRLHTTAGSVIQLRLGVVMKDFGMHHVNFG